MVASATCVSIGDDLPAPPSWLVLLLATASGLIAANLYYAQPLVGPIATSLGLSPALAGLIVTTTQVGYVAGLLLIVPVGDLFENRNLVLCMLCVVFVGLLGSAASVDAATFLGSALLIGVGSTAVQVLVPYAAHLAPGAIRGRVVGNVMSGLMLGIMLARPAASFIADALSWRAVFLASTLVVAGLGLLLWRALPVRAPEPGPGYRSMLASMAGLALRTPVLQRRASSHACLFAAFSLFWTVVPLLLADRFGLSQRGIAVFALAGVAGTVAAPLAGRAADRGWTRRGTGLAMLAVAASFPLGWLAPPSSEAGVLVLAGAAILLDFGVAAHFVFGQRAIFSLEPEFRSRLNGLYMATFFAGGAVGSAIGGWAYARGGWGAATLSGAALPLIALLFHTLNGPRGGQPG